jgi:hypothetical protein
VADGWLGSRAASSRIQVRTTLDPGSPCLAYRFLEGRLSTCQFANSIWLGWIRPSRLGLACLVLTYVKKTYAILG